MKRSMHLEGVREWIGRSESAKDFLDPRRCEQLAGAIDSPISVATGQALPLPWHWIFFNPIPGANTTGPDGHPARGTFMPPVALPRRMWAGGHVRVERPLLVGENATRTSRITDIAEKSGKQGRLVFVTVEHEYFNAAGDLALWEAQDIVYREPPAATAEKNPEYQPEVPSQWRGRAAPDPVLLFRYAALTYNAHRIHYDRDWAVNEEGYPGLVVQGPLVATLLLALLAGNRPDCRVIEFRFRGVRPLCDLAPFELHGAPVDEGALLWALTPEKTLAMSISCRLATAC